MLRDLSGRAFHRNPQLILIYHHHTATLPAAPLKPGVPQQLGLPPPAGAAPETPYDAVPPPLAPLPPQTPVLPYKPEPQPPVIEKSAELEPGPLMLPPVDDISAPKLEVPPAEP